jgi:hypothetical protein
MPKKKKVFTYEFADGFQEIPSSYKAKCTITGELVPIYHKFLETLIKKKYKNNFAYFLKHFAKKGAEEKRKASAGYDKEDKYSLNAYSDYLILCYKSCLNTLEDNFNEQSIKKAKTEMDHAANCFRKHFNRDITKYV